MRHDARLDARLDATGNFWIISLVSTQRNGTMIFVPYMELPHRICRTCRSSVTLAVQGRCRASHVPFPCSALILARWKWLPCLLTRATTREGTR